MKPRCTKRKKPPEPTFAALMAREESRVMEHLQLFGEFRHTAHGAAEMDWLHTLDMLKTDAFEQCRFELSDPVVVRILRERLAALAQACAMWDKELR